MNKAIFIDKDGTLVHDIPYNVNPDLISFEKYALESMKRLQEAGFKLIIITNQAGLALNYFTEKELKAVEQKIREEWMKKQIRLDGFYFCPHSPESHCRCRKPQPGLILKAADEMQIDCSQSWMIGDILHDVEAGNRSGVRTILIDNGNETEWELSPVRQPDFILNDLREAASVILSNHKQTEYAGLEQL